MADKFLEDVKKMGREIVAGLSPESQIAYADSERHAELATQQRQRNREAEARRQATTAENLRAERERAFGQAIRNKFFESNPHATQADFERLWPKLRDEAMMRAMDQPDSGVEAYAENARYNV